MIVAELLKIGRELLKVLSVHDVKIDDWRYVELYEMFVIMRAQGTKYCVAVDELAKQFKISRATAERIIKRFKREC